MTPQDILNDSKLPECIRARMAEIQEKRIQSGCIARDGASFPTAYEANMRNKILDWIENRKKG